MTVDSLTLAAVASELRRRAAGLSLGAVLVPRREQVVLGLDRGGFFVSIQAAEARAHLVSDLPAPPRLEPGIQAHLDSLLRGGELTAAGTVDFDRVMRLVVDNLDRIGNPRRYTVVIELMGKHSAFTVLDDEAVILATLKPVTRAVNRHRELLPRVAYVPPPGRRENPLTLDAEGFAAGWPALRAAPSVKEGWRRVWYGMSDDLWACLGALGDLPDELGPTATDAELERLWQAWQTVADAVREERYQPCLRRDEHGRPILAYPLPLPGAEPIDSLSAGLEAVYGATRERNVLAERRGLLLGRLKRAAARAESGLQGIARRERRAAEAETWQHQADLLLANLHRLPPRAEALEVEDYLAPGAPVTIPLDPSLTGPQNADALYTRARKARQGSDNLPAEREALAAERDRLAELETALRAATDLATLARLERETPEAGGPPPAPKPKTERDKALARLARQTSSDGYQLLIGRNSSESEGLLSRVAAPTDIWLHVRGAGSGHVIIRTEGKPEAVPPRTIEEAAIWAARQSKMKHSSVVPVVYTQRKHVTKVKGGQAGKVVYRQEKTIFVDPTR